MIRSVDGSCNALISYTGIRSSTLSGFVKDFKVFEPNFEGYICQNLSRVARATPLVWNVCSK
jgi:hypothetical protein